MRSPEPRRSANEVDDDKMKNKICEDVVCERSLRAERLEFVLVLWIHLDAQAHCTENSTGHVTLIIAWPMPMAMPPPSHTRPSHRCTVEITAGGNNRRFY